MPIRLGWAVHTESANAIVDCSCRPLLRAALLHSVSVSIDLTDLLGKQYDCGMESYRSEMIMIAVGMGCVGILSIRWIQYEPPGEFARLGDSPGSAIQYGK